MFKLVFRRGGYNRGLVFDIVCFGKVSLKEFVKEALTRSKKGWITLQDRSIWFEDGNVLSGYFEDIKNAEVVPL